MLPLTMQVCGDMLGIKAVVTAMIGLSALLVTGVLEWKDCLQYDSAWNTLFWFSGEQGQEVRGCPGSCWTESLLLCSLLAAFEHSSCLYSFLLHSGGAEKISAHT